MILVVKLFENPAALVETVVTAILCCEICLSGIYLSVHVCVNEFRLAVSSLVHCSLENIL